MSEHDDLPWEAALAKLEELMDRGYVAFVKWTCPKCGERVMSDQPNTISLTGYIHTERTDGSPCGFHYAPAERTGVYGFFAVKAFGESPAELTERLRRILGNG